VGSGKSKIRVDINAAADDTDDSDMNIMHGDTNDDNDDDMN